MITNRKSYTKEEFEDIIEKVIYLYKSKKGGPLYNSLSKLGIPGNIITAIVYNHVNNIDQMSSFTIGPEITIIPEMELDVPKTSYKDFYMYDDDEKTKNLESVLFKKLKN